MLPENAPTTVEYVHVVYWAFGVVMLGAQVFLAAPWRERRERSPLMPAVVWAVVPALFLIVFGVFGWQTGLGR